MSAFVKSLRRLYAAGRVSEDQLEGLRTKGKLSDNEIKYIVRGIA